jgi:hypothetical protein
MTSPSNVRAAVPEDASEIWRLLRMLCAENGMFNLSEKRVDFYISRLLNPSTIAKDDTGPRGFIGVIGPVGALEGCIMLTVGSVWYSEDFTLDEHLNFVDPAHRSSNHAKALIRFAKESSDKIGIPLVIGILSTKRTAAKVRLYSQELTPCGAFFIYPAPKDTAMTFSTHENAVLRIDRQPKKYRPHRDERLRLKAMVN